tara:strand:- start:2935 stop:4461 length:1527 start_codon:yes stop_codon:yes gene_type:complete
VSALMQRLREHPRDFFKFLMVFDKDAKKLVPFVLNEEQELLLDTLLEHDRIVVCKARQIGCSTLIRAYFLWKTYVSQEPTTSVILSYTRESADHLHAMDKGFYLNLPAPLKRKLSKSSARTLTFKDTKATLRSFTAGGKAGSTRSFTFSSAHISEFAFFDDQDDLLANVMASVGKGQIIIETTPNTPGDKYHDLVIGAPQNGWQVCFFPWHKHKKYQTKSQFSKDTIPSMTDKESDMQKKFGLSKAQMYWRRTQVSSMGLEKFRREFPSTIDEAFISSSRLWFPTDVLDKTARIPMNGTRWTDDEYIDGDRYYMGVDVALGTGRDYSSIVIISGTTLQPVFIYRDNQILPEKLAEIVWEMHHQYDEAHTIVEADGPGYTVLYRLKEWKMRNMYKNKRGKDWHTRADNKVKIFDNVRGLLCNDYFDALPQPLWAEMRNCGISDKGIPGHQKGGYDDTTIAFCLAQWYAYEYPTPTITQTKRTMIEKFKSKQRARLLRSNGPIPYRRKEW